MSDHSHHGDASHPHSGPGHKSSAKDQGIVQEAQKPLGTIAGFFPKIGVLVLLLFVIFNIRSCRERGAEAEAEKTAQQAAARAATPGQAPVQRPGVQGCNMPCSLTIFGPFNIEGPGTKMEVTAPLKGGKRHTFSFEADGKFAKQEDEKLWATLWNGEYDFTTPESSGLPVYVVKR